jgi:dTDP-glucose 4,6-dehydratase
MPRVLADDLDHILEHTHDLWNDLRGNRLFLTGGTGFFGCWLLESLSWANERLDLDAGITVLTRDAGRFRQKAPHLADAAGVELFEGDVRTFTFPAGEFTHVIHAATDSAVVPSVPEVVDTITTGTARVLEFANQGRTRKLLFTSSGAIYGKQPSELSHVGEDYTGAPDPLLPSSGYGTAKRLAELQCALAAHSTELDAKIARCFAFLGPYMNLDVHFAVGNFLSDQMRGGPITVKGDGSAVRSYLYASDLAIWLWTLLFRKTEALAYNVGSENAINIADLARTVAASGPRQVEVRIEGKPSGAPPARYVPSTQRIRGELGLEQTVSLEEGIAKTRRWFLSENNGRSHQT